MSLRPSGVTYYAANREAIRAQRAARYAADREGINRRRRERYAETRHAVLARRRLHQRRYNASYYAAYAEQERARAAAYQKAHPDKHRTSALRRRAREMGAMGSHTTQQWRELVVRFGGCCVYCGKAGPLDRDHKVPLVRGGSNDIGNIVPACRSCNSRKGKLTADEFLGVAA